MEGLYGLNGLNEPLRSGKNTSFEGGVRVPAFAVDLSGGKYCGRGGREFKGMVHISDWLPTFLSLAKGSHLYENLELDGIDQSRALATGKKVLSIIYMQQFSIHPRTCRREDQSCLICTVVHLS